MSTNLATEITRLAEPFNRTQHGKPLLPIAPEALYQFAQLIRLTEQLILDLFSQGLVSGTTHTCLGHELCQMAVVRALDHPRDVVLSNHRNHGHFLTYSGDFFGLIAEVMGRQDGVCGGVGGSQHIAYRHFHSNGVQAGMTAIGVGEALARKWERDGSIVVTIVGDGTLGEGLLYESLNLGSIWRTPMLFVVERNHVAQTTPTSDVIGGSIEARSEAFGYLTWSLEDTAPDFFQRVEEVVQAVRRTGEPGFLVIDTRRLGPHSKGDDSRPPDELEAIRGRDPLIKLGATLDPDVRAVIERVNVAYVHGLRERALESPLSKYGRVPRHTFENATPWESQVAAAAPSGTGSVRLVINAALRRLLEEDSRVVLLGEDLHDPYGGAFKVTIGLSSAFPGRVISTPISEAALVGVGIGLALAGYRPVVEIMFADFLTLAADQIYNHAIKFGALFPEISVPLVIRTPSGGRRGYGPTHSQSPENIFVAFPGLTVVFPSQRHDSDRLLTLATQAWDYPVVFFEHKLLYGVEQACRDYEIIVPSPADSAAHLFPTLRGGDDVPDVTLVAYGGIVALAEEVAEHLREQEELAVEIVVPSLLAPLPIRTILSLLRNRSRIVVIEESQSEHGVGAELGAVLLEAGFRGAFARVGCPPVPIPSARSLEADLLPHKRDVLQQILAMF